MARVKNKRDQILSSASEIFAINGYHDASINEIADNANVGKGTIYEYFDSKMTLYIEVLKYNIERYLTRIRNVVISESTFNSMLESYIGCHTEILKENFKYAGIMMNNSADLIFNSKNSQETLKILMDTRVEVVQIILDILTVGHNEGQLSGSNLDYYADLFFEMLNRSALRSLMMQHSEEQQLIEKDLLVKMLINGIGQ
ncbi:TetR/AcrR family transcriptional regulator [Fusibacter bizertensis]|jgi:Transcriptional regulator|uniref:TetR/AcrR family transcriptional regulator n=1 Tax=Fusibacter bizertensis TaxID=1488331 RepID=A0ABT6NBJ4_9FIRM|nr:TetR/AcrR family transcriptional regulator [Fusibacter bizertensis]MDH8677774.1 TetR/AcrR family transcriptional regulator [Fusibacter bizertensis]